MIDSDHSQSWLPQVPYGQLVTRQWLLERLGVPVHSLDNALKSGKLESLARGVVARPGVKVTWEGVVASLNRMLGEKVYVGGLSALSEAGLSHYLDFSGRLHLYSFSVEPSWLPKLPMKTEFVWHRVSRLWDEQALMASHSLKEMPFATDVWQMASVEQAFLEVLMDVPRGISFEHADNLMQGMSSLSPRRLDSLLRACRHVKVKRLFFFFADRYEYPWRKKLNPQDYDLGAGKRVVAEGGRLNREYKITVPREFHG